MIDSFVILLYYYFNYRKRACGSILGDITIDACEWEGRHGVSEPDIRQTDFSSGDLEMTFDR